MKNASNLDSASNTARMILDFLLNVPFCEGPQGIIETLKLSSSEPGNAIESEWNALIAHHVIVNSDYRFFVNPSLTDAARIAVQHHLAQSGVTQAATAGYFDDLERHNETGIATIANFLGHVYSLDGMDRVVFSDYHRPPAIVAVGDEMTKLGLAFKASGHSRRHSYLTYYLRAWPFEAGHTLRDEVFRRLNVAGLTNEGWKVLLLLSLPRDGSLRYEVVAANMDLADVELRELVTSLKVRGLLTESARYVSIPKALAAPVSEYFRTSIYPDYKQKSVDLLKQKLASSLSHLWPVSGAKRLAEMNVGETVSSPLALKLVPKSDAGDLDRLLPDLIRLGLALDLDDRIAILLDILKETESWLKGSMRTSTMFIPRRDFYLAREVLRSLFARCEGYVKVQDPQLAEDSIDVLEYVPPDLPIYLLGGVKPGAGEDAAALCHRIERFRVSRGDTFDVRFAGKDTGATPFHDRFIISRRRVWISGTSLNEIGGDKDTAIAEFPKDKGGEQIELAFDSLWFAGPEYLERNGYERLDLDGWKARYGLSE